MKGHGVLGPTAAILAAAAVTLTGCQAGADSGEARPADEVQVLLRQVAAIAPVEFAEGKALFEEYCSACHGPAADGTEQGPPLAHKIYEPSHHADAAFVLAVRIGVRAHHWRFGDMQPVPAVTEEMVPEIVGYVRWLQREVGID